MHPRLIRMGSGCCKESAVDEPQATSNSTPNKHHQSQTRAGQTPSVDVKPSSSGVCAASQLPVRGQDPCVWHRLTSVSVRSAPESPALRISQGSDLTGLQCNIFDTGAIDAIFAKYATEWGEGHLPAACSFAALSAVHDVVCVANAAR